MHPRHPRLPRILVTSTICAFVFFYICKYWISTELQAVGAVDLKQVALVVASQAADNTLWLDGVFPSWEKAIYLADAPSQLSVPANKGREGMVYLTYD